MQPSQLTADSFATYPAEAKALAIAHLDLLRQLPLAFLPLLLRETIVYDWRFPAERAELDDQIAFLSRQDAATLSAMMKPFSDLRLTPELAATDWINVPAEFSERLSAYLWSSHQIDAFRTASVNYVHQLNESKPAKPPSLPRLTIVLAGRDASVEHAAFRKLRPLGVRYTNIEPQPATSLVDFVAARAGANPAPFAHWYIDGAECAAKHAGVTCVSYAGLAPVREALLAKMTKVMAPGGGGPELLRSELQRMRPEDLAFPENANPVLSRFQLSLLTEGSGTQIFSTTFVQWAAREALRRAQPETLLARYAPRRKEASIGVPSSAVDPDASLVDAEMGAYYTWINQQRLSGAEQSRFVAWYEAHREAIAIGPNLKAGGEQNAPTRIDQLLAEFS